jgi:putative addiction module component (TIGR02574 family)
MSKSSLADILSLPVAERINLVEDIWDSIAEVPEDVPLSQAQREELDQRLEEYHRNPEAGSPWEDIKTRLRGS